MSLQLLEVIYEQHSGRAWVRNVQVGSCAIRRAGYLAKPDLESLDLSLPRADLELDE